MLSSRIKRRWETCKRVIRDTAQTIRLESPDWPLGYRLHLRLMGKSQSQSEGFALYEHRTLRINRRVLSLPQRDWILLAIHEIGGHHLQRILQDHRRREECDSDRCQASEEFCGMSCERKWAKRFNIEHTAREWMRYRRARAALDNAVKRGLVATDFDARQLFKQYRVPKRLTRVRLELLRVRERPSEVLGYLHGRLRDSPDCPCGEKKNAV